MDENSKFEEVLQRLTRIEEKIDDYKDIRNKAEDAYNTSKQNTKDIGDIKDIIKKLTYGCGAMAISIIAFFIKITLFKN
jgi:DNA repair exonuclease SbcCD ATPase subunit